MKKLSYFTVLLAILAMIILLGCESRMSPMETTGTEQGETNTLAKGKSGGSGKSNTAHLYLHEKDPSDWSIVEDGAWGKMKYNLEGAEFKFVFNGHGLDEGVDYLLIYYPDPWPGTGLIVLGAGTANDEYNVHIMGSVNTGDLPIATDANDGAKIWLILADDYDEVNASWNAWNPTEYLFEYDLISFNDTDD